MITGFIVLAFQEHILLGHHTDGFWRLPGGKGEPGETCLQAMLRELREETGIHLEYKFFNLFIRNEESIVFCSEVPYLPRVVNKEPNKFFHWAWFPARQIHLDRVNHYERPVIQEYLRYIDDRSHWTPLPPR